jgi:hypothetical protein
MPQVGDHRLLGLELRLQLHLRALAIGRALALAGQIGGAGVAPRECLRQIRSDGIAPHECLRQIRGAGVARRARLRQICDGRFMRGPLIGEGALEAREPRDRGFGRLLQLGAGRALGFELRLPIGARAAFFRQLLLSVLDCALKITGRALEIGGDRLLFDKLRFESGFDLFAGCQQFGLLAVFRLRMVQLTPKIGADRLFLFKSCLP